MTEVVAKHALRVLEGRSAPFSYSCGGCNRCCHDKRIQIGPYEIARLAARLRVTTGAFIARHTDEGTSLRFVDGACTFLTSQGCSVHADRPLVCRLYPLGRIDHPDGTEQIAELRGHPETKGSYGVDGTVEQYFVQQGAAPYIAAARLYYELLERVVGRLDEGPKDGVDDSDARTALEHEADVSDADVEDPPSLIDIDAVVAKFCADTDRPVPTDIWDRMLLHIQATDAWLEGSR